ncbi:MAG: DinB family protein [Planctomycetota bacterium]|jgi:hypothetical protein
MASAKDVIRNQLQNGQQLIEMYTGDLSDEEYFHPATPGTNHAAWILGHIAVSEDSLVSMITGQAKRFPQAVHDLLGPSSTCESDASKYPSRSELDEMFRNSRAHTVEALQTFDEGKWVDPAPEGLPKQFFWTAGAVWGLIGFHQFWHIGQLTTCRTVMNKKRLLT